MNEDEAREKRIAAYVIGQETGEFSVDEVSETIEALKVEIERLEKLRDEKSAHMQAAASFFKT